MVGASSGPVAKRARPSSVDDVMLSQEAAAPSSGGKAGKAQGGHKGGAMLTLAEVSSWEQHSGGSMAPRDLLHHISMGGVSPDHGPSSAPPCTSMHKFTTCMRAFTGIMHERRSRPTS